MQLCIFLQWRRVKRGFKGYDADFNMPEYRHNLGSIFGILIK